MRIQHPKQNNFRYGELSPTYAGRTDSSVYYQGVETYKNFVTRLSGGATFRPGTILCAWTNDQSNPTRLIPFVKDADNKFILEFGDEEVSIYKDHAHVTDLTATWGVADVFDIKYVQIENKLYCAHKDYPTQLLTCAGTSVTWTISAVVWTSNTALASGAFVHSSAFNVTDNYPTCLAYHCSRMYVGGNTTYPQDIWGSKLGEVSNFTYDASDGGAFNYILASRDCRQVQWLESHPSGLMVGTLLGEGLLMDNVDGYITPANPMKFRWVTEFGSSKIQGVPFDGRILFVQEGNRILREYYPTQDAYNSPTMTYLAEHILKDVVDIAVQREPWPMIWVVKDDGTIALLSRSRETEVMAWSDIVTNGEFESVAVIPGDEEDEVWVTVKRTVGTNDKRSLEYFKPFICDSQPECHHVDCGAYIDGGSDTISTLTVNTPKTITDITRANPAVVTASGHGFSNGDTVYIDDVGGMAEVNERHFTVAGAATDTFQLNGEDSTLHTTYTSGGEVVETPNIYIETTTALATLGWGLGSYVRITGVGGTTELNSRVFPMTDLGTTTFLIDTSDVIHYTTWTSGGTLERVYSSVSGDVAHLAGEVVAITVDGAHHASGTAVCTAMSLDGYYCKIHAGLQYDGVIESMNLNPLLGNSRLNKAQIRFYQSLGGKIGASESTAEDIIFTTGSDVASTAEWYTGDYTHEINDQIETDTRLVIKQDQSLPMTVLAYAVREGVHGG